MKDMRNEQQATEVTPEVRIADLEGQVQFWKSIYEKTDARLKDLRKTFDEVMQQAKDREAAENEMKARVKYEIDPKKNDHYAEIQLPWIEAASTVWMRNGGRPEISQYLPMNTSPRQADEAALALQVLAGIGREWEAESKE